VVSELWSHVRSLPWLRECFSSIDFASALLSHNESYYHGVKSGRGPSLQWLRIFKLAILEQMDYFILLEPDTVAIKDYWLDTVYQQVAFATDDFWIKGSINRIPSWPAFHINGNAIYKLHDEEFDQTVLEPVRHDIETNYDLKIYNVFEETQKKNPALFKRIKHKIVHSDFIQDHASLNKFSPEVLKDSNTVLVHNKGAVLEWITGHVISH